MGDGPGVEAHGVGRLAKRRRAPVPEYMPKLFGRLVEAQTCMVGIGARPRRDQVDARTDAIGRRAMAVTAFARTWATRLARGRRLSFSRNGSKGRDRWKSLNP